MDCQVDKKSHFRHLLFDFNRGQNSSKAARDICVVYGEGAITEKTVRDYPSTEDSVKLSQNRNSSFQPVLCMLGSHLPSKDP